MAARFFLAEMEGRNPVTAAVETLYFTDGPGLATEVGDDPADVYYVPRLLLPDDATYERHLYSDGTTGGASIIKISEDIAINDVDGVYDYLRTWAWDGRAFRLYQITEGAARSTAVLVLSAVMEQLLPVLSLQAGKADSRMVIRLKDPLSRFDVPIQPAKYAGTNVGPTGLEGLPDDIKGLPKPLLWGRAYEVPIRQANASLLIGQAADGAMAAFDAVYDNGVLLALDADYATPSLLAAATPASGEYATCLRYGYEMLGATPAGTITADVSTVAATLPSGDAVDLDGADDFYGRSAAMVGGGASMVGIVSAWFRVDGGNGTLRVLDNLRDSAGEVACRVALLSSNKLRLEWTSPSGASRGTLTSTSAYAAGATWRHVLAAWDFGAGTAKLYVDNVDETNAALSTPDTIGPLGGNCQVGAEGSGFSPANFWNGALAEVWIGWGQWLDLTVAGHRQRFRTAGGYPADLGATGAKPTGTTPLLYLRGGPAAFGVNLGTGGDLVQHSAPAVASSAPYAPAPSVPSTVTAPEIIRTIVQSRVGLLDAEIDAAAFAQAILDAPEDVGVWVGDERSVRDVLDEVANSAALAYWFRSDGVLSIGRFTLPSGTPVATLTLDDIISIEAQPIYDIGFGLPTYSVVVEHRKIYAVQPGNGLAGSVSAERRAYLEQEYRRSTPTQDNTVKAAHPQAPEQIFRTLITNIADADAFAADRLALYSRQRFRWKVRVWLDATAAAFDLFDVVNLRLVYADGSGARFGHQGGKLYRIIGIATDFRGSVVDLDLWGGVPAPVEPSGIAGGVLGTLRIRRAQLPLHGIAGGALGTLTLARAADRRITEPGDLRITEDGDVRVLEDA